MYEIVEGIHKALRIEGTWAFVLLMGVFGFLGVGALALIIDLGYRNSAEYKADHPPKSADRSGTAADSRYGTQRNPSDSAAPTKWNAN